MKQIYSLRTKPLKVIKTKEINIEINISDLLLLQTAYLIYYSNTLIRIDKIEKNLSTRYCVDKYIIVCTCPFRS